MDATPTYYFECFIGITGKYEVLYLQEINKPICDSNVALYIREVKAVEKPPAQIERERMLLPGIPFNRWYCLPAAIIIQICCGSVYAWSVFNKPIDELIYGEFRSISPTVFYIAIGTFGVATATMGPWEERHGPMKSCLLGSSLFLLGNLTTALALLLKQMWMVFLGSGFIVGFGLGIIYMSPVAALQKWFPDKRGLASGISVSGFGAGTIAISKASIPMTELVGLPLTFVIFGLSYFFFMGLAGLVLRTPPSNFYVGDFADIVIIAPKPLRPKQKDIASKSKAPTTNTIEISETFPDPPQLPNTSREIPLIEALTSSNFRLMYVMFLSNAIFGMVMFSNLSNIVTDIFLRSPETAATVVAVTGAFNTLGRIGFSILSDYIGRKNCYMVMLSFQLLSVSVFTLITITRTYWAFILSMWIVVACYGAGFGVIPAFLSDTFGATNVASCHGVILTAEATAAVCGGFAYTAIFNIALSFGYTQHDPFPYNLNVWWIIFVVAIGWTALFFVTPTIKDLHFMKSLKRCLCRVFAIRKSFKLSS